jgi:hypothetical protein
LVRTFTTFINTSKSYLMVASLWNCGNIALLLGTRLSLECCSRKCE